ncbi:hypothetical protein BJI49_04715 [Acetobacter pasteurianus]|uniref:hypothetical protein n=1 Tax=Acetobacter pasteurianus TaxID=438 RepID=UPI000245757C|nr:hypothetical protein [Acetobacter pasteurianus]RCL08418.1 hypothetical protein BJI49_04715 [Acetobacter pasteurianus]GAB29608.1 hypothetical protein APS_0210 [Acetobacter pasteurianus subsp. pasteurianus LMG 1262 = NBRC 106471]
MILASYALNMGRKQKEDLPRLPHADKPRLFVMPERQLSRRVFLNTLLGGAAAIMAGAHTARAEDSLATSADGGSALIIGGTSSSECGRWASLLAPALEEELHLSPPLQLTPTTGWDGITGANLFDTQQQSAPGPVGLIVPGTAILSAMLGGPRIHFDYRRWAPVFLVAQPSVAVGRISLHQSFRARLSGQLTRVAVSKLTGPELTTVLALDMLGLRPQPVAGHATPEAAMATLQAGQTDVIQLPLDASYPSRIATLQAAGFAPLFVNNARPDMQVHQPNLPPDLLAVLQQEHKYSQPAFLLPAWGAIAAACSLHAGLVLPALTQPDSIARWRHAAEICANRPAIQQAAAAENQTILAGTAGTPFYETLMPEPHVLMALRRWFAQSLPRWRDATPPALLSTPPTE